MRSRHKQYDAGTLEVHDADLSAEDIRTAYRQAACLAEVSLALPMELS